MFHLVACCYNFQENFLVWKEVGWLSVLFCFDWESPSSKKYIVLLNCHLQHKVSSFLLLWSYYTSSTGSGTTPKNWSWHTVPVCHILTFLFSVGAGWSTQSDRLTAAEKQHLTSAPPLPRTGAPLGLIRSDWQLMWKERGPRAQPPMADTSPSLTGALITSLPFPPSPVPLLQAAGSIHQIYRSCLPLVWYLPVFETKWEGWQSWHDISAFQWQPCPPGISQGEPASGLHGGSAPP